MCFEFCQQHFVVLNGIRRENDRLSKPLPVNQPRQSIQRRQTFVKADRRDLNPRADAVIWLRIDQHPVYRVPGDKPLRQQQSIDDKPLLDHVDLADRHQGTDRDVQHEQERQKLRNANSRGDSPPAEK